MAARDFPFHVLKNPGTVTVASSGLAWAPTLEAPNGLTSVDDEFGTYLEHGTGAAAGSAAGLITSFDVLAAGWRPAIEFEVMTPATQAAIQQVRYWVGLFSLLPDSLFSPTLGQEQHFAAFRYDPVNTTPAAHQFKWHRLTSNNGAVDANFFGGDVLPSRRYRLRIEIDSGSPPTLARFFSDDGQVGGSFTLPGLPRLLGIGIRVVNLSASDVKKLLWNRVSWRYDNRLL